MNYFDDEWILENYPNYKHLRDLFDAYHETHENGTYRGFEKHVRVQLGLKSQFTYTDEQTQWIIDNYSHYGMKKAHLYFNETFGTVRTMHSIRSKAYSLGINVSEEENNEHRNAVRFDPIGTIKVNDKGYTLIKTGKGTSKWENYHKYLWEQANGPVPEGYIVIFLDGNKQNFELSNLEAIPAKYNSMLNRNHLRSSDKRITETAIKWCELYSLVKN